MSSPVSRRSKIYDSGSNPRVEENPWILWDNHPLAAARFNVRSVDDLQSRRAHVKKVNALLLSKLPKLQKHCKTISIELNRRKGLRDEKFRYLERLNSFIGEKKDRLFELENFPAEITQLENHLSKFHQDIVERMGEADHLKSKIAELKRNRNKLIEERNIRVSIINAVYLVSFVTAIAVTFLLKWL